MTNISSHRSFKTRPDNVSRDPAAFVLVRNAHVTVREIKGPANRGAEAEVTVWRENDEPFVHRYDASSRISRHLKTMTPMDLGERLSGGHFMFVEDKMVDFRDGSYTGFVHSDSQVAQFAKLFGAKEGAGKPGDLSRSWAAAGISVPGVGEGGDFEATTNYQWSPFMHNIASSVNIMRLVCANGMRALTPVLSQGVPLENMWQEHLDIASKQLHARADMILKKRVKDMISQRASVATCQLVAQHLASRIDSNAGDDRLEQMFTIVDPITHLEGVYRDEVFDNGSVASSTAAHLSMYDVYNIVTEMLSHSYASSGSTDNALNKLASQILFLNEDMRVSVVDPVGNAKRSMFSDPNMAFFGSVN